MIASLTVVYSLMGYILGIILHSSATPSAMNRCLLLIVICTISSLQAYAQIDTLRTFDPKEFTPDNTGSPVDGTAYGVRLRLKAPALLHAVRFYRRPLDTGACLV